MSGTPEVLITQLYNNLRKGIDFDEAVNQVKTYWEEPQNRAAREQDTAKDVLERATYRLMPFASSEGLDNLVTAAKENPNAHEALKKYLSQYLSGGNPCDEKIRALLIEVLGMDQPNKKKGKPLGKQHEEYQLAAAIWALKSHDFNLSTNSPNERNAFEVVECATGKTFDITRHAWKANKKLFNNRKPQGAG